MTSGDMKQLPKEDDRIFSGRLDKKVFSVIMQVPDILVVKNPRAVLDMSFRFGQVLASEGVQWQSRLAVLTEDILAFSSIKGDTREYWPEQSSVTLDNLRKVFDDHDVDNSGYLDASEVRECLGTLNVRLTNCLVAILRIIHKLCCCNV